ncbi:MAG: polymer-forming cytoskeletal protein [Pseudomonadota bacterium]
MFSKAKDKNSTDAKTANAADQASGGSEIKRSGAARPAAGVPSIICSDVTLTGNINAAGELQFDGVIDGDVRAGSLIIGEHASVTGEVICEKVVVRGRVEGGIRAIQVNLAATAQIIGDIVHSTLAVETGAHFEGACRHSDDPLSEAAERDFRKQRLGAPAVKTAAANGAAETPRPADRAATAAGADANDTPSFLTSGRSPLR